MFFTLGYVAWGLAFDTEETTSFSGNVRLDKFAWHPSLEKCGLGSSLGKSSLGPYACGPSLGSIALDSFHSEFDVYAFHLKSFAWMFSLGIFLFLFLLEESVAWDISCPRIRTPSRSSQGSGQHPRRKLSFLHYVHVSPSMCPKPTV